MLRLIRSPKQNFLSRGLSAEWDQKLMADLDIVPDNNNSMKALSKNLVQHKK